MKEPLTKEFERHGCFPNKQILVSPNDGDAAISIADFAVPAKRLVIYIDGAAFHVGERLRGNWKIRE